MPISKQDAFANAQARDQGPIDQFCARVDGAIADNAGTGMKITISTVGVPQHVVERVIETYSKLDWKCEHISDQRDGNYLQLS